MLRNRGLGSLPLQAHREPSQGKARLSMLQVLQVRLKQILQPLSPSRGMSQAQALETDALRSLQSHLHQWLKISDGGS